MLCRNLNKKIWKQLSKFKSSIAAREIYEFNNNIYVIYSHQ